MPSFLLILPALIQAGPSHEQASNVLVTVRDIPGDPLAGAKVSMEGNLRGLSGETNELGMLSFGLLPPGKYFLKAEKEGYRPHSQPLQLEGTPARKIEVRMVKETATAPKKPKAPGA